MATISSTQIISDPTGSWSSTAELDTNTGTITVIVNGSSGKIQAQGTPEQAIAQINALAARAPQYKDFYDNVVSVIVSQQQSLTAQYQQQVPPPNTEPVPPATSEQQTEQQNKQYIASGGADDDKGTVQGSNNSAPATTDSASGNGSTSTGDTTSGSLTFTTTPTREQQTEKKPTVRVNPLSDFASYTYQISLYMLTPDAYNAFAQSNFTNINDLVAKTKTGGGNIDGGAYLILQSGGINRETTPTAPGFNLDFYVDNLIVNSVIGTGKTRTATFTTEISFQVIEPYGFSFLTKLKQASDAIQAYSKSLNLNQQKNPSRFFFALGIRFQGYDESGHIITGKEMINGSVLAPSGTTTGLFETFYPISIRKLSFKIDGKTTTYSINAVSLATESFSTKNGLVEKNITIQAKNVELALTGPTGLIQQLNDYQASLAKSNEIEIPHQYKVEFIGPLDNFKSASIVKQADINKISWPFSNAKNSEQVNEKTAAEASPSNAEKVITIGKGSFVLTAIEQIVKQSEYLLNALQTMQTTELENNPKTDAPDELPIDAKNKIKWYNVASHVKVLGFDTKTNDWAYEFTYVISPYETPVVLSPYIKNASNYYGPVKRYEYWFTGQNSEVLNYEQTNENGYFISVVSTKTAQGKTTGATANIPIKTNTKQDSDSQGALYIANQSQASYLATDLYDPKSYSQAKILILGDPDFLVKDSFNNKAGAVYNQFYGPDGRTINPNGGQVLIEVNFKEGVDYNTTTGLMDINDSITFWQYPDNIKKIVKGVSYRVTTVVSSFKQGKFTQELTCIINTFGPSDNSAGARQDNFNDAEMQKFQRQGSGGTNSLSTNGTGAVGNNGLKSAPTTRPTTPIDTPSQINKPETADSGTRYETYGPGEGGRE